MILYYTSQLCSAPISHLRSYSISYIVQYIAFYQKIKKKREKEWNWSYEQPNKIEAVSIVTDLESCQNSVVSPVDFGEVVRDFASFRKLLSVSLQLEELQRVQRSLLLLGKWFVGSSLLTVANIAATNISLSSSSVYWLLFRASSTALLDTYHWSKYRVLS